MLTEELDYTTLKKVFYDENSQTPRTQRFNKLLKDNGVDFEVCLSREDNHLYMYTGFLKIPLFKSRYSCTESNWVSSQTKLIPLYKVLKTFSTEIEHGEFEGSTDLELSFVYDKRFNVTLELFATEEVKIKVAYYHNHRRFSSHDFSLKEGFLEVYSEGLGSVIHFKYSVEDTVPLSEFTHSTLIGLKNKVKDNMEALGYKI